MKKLVSIPEVNIDKFEAKMKKLIKVAKKLNVPEVKFNLLKKEVRKCQSDYVLYYDYEIEGEAPTLNGYQMVAILERVENGNLTHHSNKNIELPENLSERENYCDHCKTNRRRKYLFILHNEETNEYIQVGKSCVKDFTDGHISPEWVADYYSIIYDFDEMENNFSLNYSGDVHFYIETEKAIAISAYLTDKKGYVKTDEGTKERPSTKFETIKILNSLSTEEKHGKHDTADMIETYRKVAQDVIKWIEGKDSNNDYINNLKVLLSGEAFKINNIGFVVSAYSSYKRDMERVKKELEKENSKESEFVGEIGKRKDYTLTYDKMFQFDSIYGITSIYIFKDEEGNVFVWKTSKYQDFKAGDKVEMKATLKEHNEYNGVKQNILTRCKIKETV